MHYVRRAGGDVLELLQMIATAGEGERVLYVADGGSGVDRRDELVHHGLLPAARLLFLSILAPLMLIIGIIRRRIHRPLVEKLTAHHSHELLLLLSQQAIFLVPILLAALLHCWPLLLSYTFTYTAELLIYSWLLKALLLCYKSIASISRGRGEREVS
jgi:hypothetical protein